MQGFQSVFCNPPPDKADNYYVFSFVSFWVCVSLLRKAHMWLIQGIWVHAWLTKGIWTHTRLTQGETTSVDPGSMGQMSISDRGRNIVFSQQNTSNESPIMCIWTSWMRWASTYSRLHHCSLRSHSFHHSHSWTCSRHHCLDTSSLRSYSLRTLGWQTRKRCSHREKYSKMCCRWQHCTQWSQ